MASDNSEAMAERPVGQLWVELHERDRSKICETIVKHNKTDVLEQFTFLVRFTYGLHHPQQPTLPPEADETRRSPTAQGAGSQPDTGEVAERIDIGHVADPSEKQASPRNKPSQSEKHGAMFAAITSSLESQSSPSASKSNLTISRRPTSWKKPVWSTATTRRPKPGSANSLTKSGVDRTSTTSTASPAVATEGSQSGPTSITPSSTTEAQSSSPENVREPSSIFSFNDSPNSTGQGPADSFAIYANPFRHLFSNQESRSNSKSIASPSPTASGVKLAAESQASPSKNDSPSDPESKTAATSQGNTVFGVVPARNSLPQNELDRVFGVSQPTRGSASPFSFGDTGACGDAGASTTKTRLSLTDSGLLGGSNNALPAGILSSNGGGSDSKTNPFGFGASPCEASLDKSHPGTDIEPFTPTLMPNGQFERDLFLNIMFQKPYEKFSAEELRLADYQRGHRFGPSPVS